MTLTDTLEQRKENILDTIILISTWVTGIGALLLLLLSLLGNIASDWPFSAAMVCVVVGCIANLIRMKKK